MIVLFDYIYTKIDLKKFINSYDSRQLIDLRI